MFIAHFGSLWKLKFTEDVPYAELLFTLLREKGIHVWDGFPCFMTEAHTDEEINTVIDAFCRSVDTMIDATFFPRQSRSAHAVGQCRISPVSDEAACGRGQTGS